MRTRRPPVPYSDAELAWLEARKTLPRRDLHAGFVAEFGRDDVDLQNLKALMKRKGWMTGRTGCWVPGQEAPNKGMKMPHNANSARTQFKPGQRPQTYRGPGNERFDPRCGYVIMIVAEKNPWTGAETRPVLKHRWLWEQANGPIPKGMRLKCLDGNTRNTDPSNWTPLPKGVIPRLSIKRGYDTAAPELKPVIMTLAKIEHAVDERRRKKTKEEAA